MKLVDILAREITEWPQGQPCLWISDAHSATIYGKSGSFEVSFNGDWPCPEDYLDAIVYKAEWQAAVDALKAEKVVECCKAPELQKEFIRLFDYNQITGSLTWKNNHQVRFIGREAGSINHHGYRRVNIGKTKLHAHQIIWTMIHGELPSCEIDHINGIRDDNRLDNLRLANQQQNQQNAGVRVDNLLGVKGVRLRPSGRYQARVKLTDGSRAVRTFSNPADAVAWLAMQRNQSHGEYARTPEQIAAEERDKAIEGMIADTNILTGIMSDRRIMAGQLYDAGYRKFEIVDN